MLLLMNNIPKNTSVKHGTNTRYTAYGCRCPKCLEAGRQHCRDYYNKLPKEQKELKNQKHLENLAKRRAEIQEHVNSLKTKACLDCGHTFPPVCMDFDHVKGSKSFNIARAVGTARNLNRILKEIAKCEVVCSNCHRIRTQSRTSPTPSDH